MSQLENIEGKDANLQRNRSIKYPRINLRRYYESIYKLSEIPIKIPTKIFDQMIKKDIWKNKHG